MTIAAEKKDEKVEKRRALGRGLESLLPGPRVVANPESRAASSESRVPSPEQVREGAGSGGGVMASQEMEGSRTGVSDPHGPTPHSPTPPTNNSPVPMAQQDAAYGAGQPRVDVPTLDSPDADQYQPGEVISIQAVAEERGPSSVIANLSIGSIDKNPYQTRFVFDDDMLQELQDSIRQHGVVQPIVVRPAEEEGRYILVLGERRLRASKLAGKTTIPAMIRRLSQQQAAEMTVLENVVREDLNPIEQANAFKVLSLEFKMTQSQIAQRIGVSRESISNYMRLLKLPQAVMDDLTHGRLTFSQARELVALDNPEQTVALSHQLQSKPMTLDQLALRVRELNQDPDVPGAKEPKAGVAKWVDPNIRAAQLEMQSILGMRVRIKDRNGRGKIVIEYGSMDDYQRVVELMRDRD